jgi:RecA/RadA recombinase
MQLALDVQIPRQLGGVEGSALYLDTEGSLMPLRMEQMAAALT